MRNYLPSASQFTALGTNQGAVLDWHLRTIEEEIAGLQSGYISPDHHGRTYHIKLARRRMKRLVKLANDFGYWLDDEPADANQPSETQATA